MVANRGGGYRSLSAAGLGAEAAAQLTLATLTGRPGLAVHELAPGRISVSRTRRPVWAVVLCVATFWLAGLGLLFLLVKRTESGEVVVSDGPRGCIVALPAVLDAPSVHAVEEALRPTASLPGSGSPAATAVDAAGPKVGTDADLEGRTVARRDLPARPTVAATAPTPRLELRFASGTVTVEPGRPVVLGRNPSSTKKVDGRVVPGDATTVSKAHLRIDFDGETATVEDLGSTNGSRLVRGAGDEPIVPGQPRHVEDGDEVVLGAVVFTVERIDAP